MREEHTQYPEKANLYPDTANSQVTVDMVWFYSLNISKSGDRTARFDGMVDILRKYAKSIAYKTKRLRLDRTRT